MNKQEWRDIFNLIRHKDKMAIIVPKGSSASDKVLTIALWRHLYEHTAVDLIIIGEKFEGKYEFINEYGVLEDYDEEKIKDRHILIVGKNSDNINLNLKNKEIIYFYPEVEEGFIKIDYPGKLLSELIWEFSDMNDYQLAHSFKDLVHISIFLDTNNLELEHSDRIKDIYKKTSMNHVYILSNLIDKN